MEHVYRMKLGFTNCYLIGTRDGFLLIDTSYPKYFVKFLHKLERLNLSPDKIKYVLLTHHHDDHAGFVDSLVKLTKARVIIHRNAIKPLSRGESENILKPINSKVEYVFSLYRLVHKTFVFAPYKVTNKDIIISKESDAFLKSIGINAVILHTPGHTKDSISVILDNGDAFVGDAAMNFMKLLGTKYRPIYVEDENEVLKSWKKLLASKVKNIFPSHGAPFSARKLEHYLKSINGAKTHFD